MSQRKQEIKEDEIKIHSEDLPIMFLNDFLMCPGSIINLRLFEPRYVMMIETILLFDKTMGILTNIRGKWYGFSLEIVNSTEQNGVYYVSGVSKKRLSLSFVSPLNASNIQVPVESIGGQQFHEQIL